MTLFAAESLLRSKGDKARSKSVTAPGINLLKIGKANQKIQSVIGQISHDQSQHYVSMGDWSTHDLLFYLLEQTGPAKVYFTTWAISEYSIRQLHNMIESGMILELKGVFDYRNGTRKHAELQFLQKITTDFKAAKCHAKVTVIINDEWGVCVVGSANYTRNPRIEANVLCTVRHVAEFHRNWILNELNGQSEFE